MRSLTQHKLLKFLSVLTLLGSGGFLVVASCLYLYLSPKLPSVEELKEIELQIPLRIHSQDLKVIAEFGEKKRSPVRFEEIPQPMIDAFLAAEDDSFFEHRGIVISGLARAAVELVTTGSIRSGGSTITMQVARNFFLSKRQEFTRKFNEILLAEPMVSAPRRRSTTAKPWINLVSVKSPLSQACPRPPLATTLWPMQSALHSAETGFLVACSRWEILISLSTRPPKLR